MLMVDDMGGGGADTKITDYVDMGGVILKADMLSLKSGIYEHFLDKMFKFFIYFIYIS